MIKKIAKSLVIGLIAISFTAIGIDAADHYGNFSESLVGRLTGSKPKGRCPDEMVLVPTETGGFCLDKYEASPNSDCSFSDPVNQDESRNNLDQVNCFAASEVSKTPWRNISQTQAQTACAKAGKRLPSDEEWYLASLGTPDKGAAWQGDDCQVASNWPLQPGVTGSGKNCVSAYGSFDMIGNVWEWVKGEISEGTFKGKALPQSGFIKAVDSQGVPIETNVDTADPNFNNDYLWIKEKDIRGIARGGYWENKSDAGVYAMYLVSPPDFAGTGIGFRCAK